MKFTRNPASGDPSSIQQSFEKIELNVHCCRYWWLRYWKHQRLSFPYWRLYWNKTCGAYVFYEEQVDLGPDRLILIPPYTPFYTGIRSGGPEEGSYCLEGGWIQSGEMERIALEKGSIPHFFIHFNLGYQYDNIIPGIYPVAPDPPQQALIRELTGNLMKGSTRFELRHSLAIYELVLSAVRKIPEHAWQEYAIGANIRKALNHINRHLEEPLDNRLLADLVHMAPNSFARLFKQQTGNSPQDFVRKRRVEHASKLLYHTDRSIKQISEACGFSDRYYFTRVFTRIMGVPPAGYRKNLRLVRVR